MGIRREEEMEMSDDDSGDNPSKKLRVDDSGKAKSSLMSPGIYSCCFFKKQTKIHI